ncbi:holin [Microbacterium sp. LWH12-1.2]|uniref:holin n=1 Tax=Microbacterium sp. LWH12-1.2 TaxID=3135259 RepID=UPI003441BB58
MSKYASKGFWVDAFDRAVSTVAQAAAAVLTANVTGLLDVDWPQIASVAGLAGLVSVLTSVAFRGKTDEPAVEEVPYSDIKDAVLFAHAQLGPDEQNADIQAAISRTH